MVTDLDVVVVGAGAAGIGAGLELRDRGLSFVILEAAGRVGGRGFTDRVPPRISAVSAVDAESLLDD